MGFASPTDVLGYISWVCVVWEKNQSDYNWKWGLAACCSKVSKRTRLVERKVFVCLFCFVFNFGGWQPWMGVGACPKADNQWARAFIDGRRRLRATCRNSIVSSNSHPKNDYAVVWSTSAWLFQVQLDFSPRVGLFPFPRGQVLKLRQLMLWLQSGHLGVHFSTCWGFQYLQDSS